MGLNIYRLYTMYVFKLWKHSTGVQDSSLSTRLSEASRASCQAPERSHGWQRKVECGSCLNCHISFTCVSRLRHSAAYMGARWKAASVTCK